MSAIFRLKYLLGLIPSANKIDANWADLLKMRDELNALENSKEVRRFKELEVLTASYEFQIKKKEILNQNYKDSTESRLIQELEKLEKSNPVRDYFKVLNSSQLTRFQEVEKIGDLNRYLQLKKKFESSVPVPDNKSSEYKEYTQLSKDQEILFYQKFKNSRLYTNFVSTKTSYELERCEELRKITSDPEFTKKVEWLRNKDRYAGTELYQQEKELKNLDKSDALKRYRKLKISPKLDFFKEWSVVFEDNFSKNAFDQTKWQAENYWGYKVMGKSFSQSGESQCFNGPKNIAVEGNTLSILTKKEKLKGQSWDPSIGLVPKEFDYSSGIINSAGSFRLDEGVIEAKVKFVAEQSLTNAFSLTGSKPMPQIDIFRSGKNCVGLGYSETTESGVTKKYKQIYGLDFDRYHIFSLEKKDHTLIWKINGEQVHEEHYHGPEEGLFLNFVSSLHEPVNNHLIPHQFQIDWVRCYSRNSQN
jgi:beta-glucanase (GH16 family)